MNKKINLRMVGLDGNAFAVMGAFQQQARREKWTAAEINTVLKEAMSSDYSHLIATIAQYCHDPV